MIKSKWIRRALLGGVAMAVMASGAQAADDLEALKAQIEALQARVNAIEAKGVNLPEGVSLITFQRGHKEIVLSGDDTKAIDKAPESRGFTIAITPTADLPAPTTEITISGVVRTVALWGKAKNTTNPSISTSRTTTLGRGKDSDFDLWARGTINIRSRTDTAIGQVRTHVQIRASFADLDELGDRIWGNDDPSAPTPDVQARLAYGEWDFMPGWTLRAGHAAQIARVANVGYPTIAAQYGVDNTRHNQILVTYNGGPFQMGLGIENPSTDDINGTTNTSTVPDFAGFVQFNAPANITLRVSGEIAKVGGRTNNAGTAIAGMNTGYLVAAGASMGISMLNLQGAFIYTKGLGCDGIFSAAAGYCRNDGGVGGANAQLAKGYGFQVNASAGLTETVTANASFGYFNYTNLNPSVTLFDRGFSVGGNLVWQPVDAFRVGAELDYFSAKPNTGSGKVTNLVGGLAFWFIF
jgi:hypothetical protein